MQRTMWDELVDKYDAPKLQNPDPVTFSKQGGIDPDPWQAAILRSKSPRIIMTASRQSGKSASAATKAMHTALYKKNSLTIVGAPSQNQSAELLKKALDMYNNTGRQVELTQESVLRVELANGSRVICVPGNTGTVRGYSAVELVIIDEAAFVPDEFYQAVMPMIAVSGGRIILMSTPWARQGSFYDIWDRAPDWNHDLPAKEQPEAWLKVKVTWRDCPRITEAFVEEYRKRYGEAAYRREFECEFIDSVANMFSDEEVQRCLHPEMEEWSYDGIT